MDRLEIKATLAVDEAGTITGNAWPFGSPDSVGDIITKGAINVAVSDLPMLFGHNPDDLVGTWTETKQTDDGLIVKGQLHMDQPRARSVRGMIQGGLVSGLSIGFRTKASARQGRNRVISALDLYEISVARNPSHPRARVTSAKQFDSAAALASALNRATAHLKLRNT
jgi:HK97 family phage prohead protease